MIGRYPDDPWSDADIEGKIRMRTPPDASPSPDYPSPDPSVPPDSMAMAVIARPPDWPTREEMALWAQIELPPHNGPANASFICGVTSLLVLGALVVMALVFRSNSLHHERLLLASVVLGEEGLIPSVLAIYFGHLCDDERYEPLLTDAGRTRAKLGVIFGYFAIVAIAAAAIALLIASGR